MPFRIPDDHETISKLKACPTEEELNAYIDWLTRERNLAIVTMTELFRPSSKEIAKLSGIE